MSTLRIEPILYKFIRCCLNRAYAMVDDSQLSAEERYSLETVLSRIRSSEESWKSVNDLIEFIKRDFVSLYEDAIKRLPKDLVKELFLKTIDLCMELEEVQANEELKRALEEARQKILSIS